MSSYSKHGMKLSMVNKGYDSQQETWDMSSCEHVVCLPMESVDMTPCGECGLRLPVMNMGYESLCQMWTISPHADMAPCGKRWIPLHVANPSLTSSITIS